MTSVLIFGDVSLHHGLHQLDRGIQGHVDFLPGGVELRNVCVQCVRPTGAS